MPNRHYNATGVPTSFSTLSSEPIRSEFNAISEGFAGVEAELDQKAGITATQTLTNKTIDLANNTLRGTLAQFNAAVTDNDLCPVAGPGSAQTFTVGQLVAQSALVNGVNVSSVFPYASGTPPTTTVSNLQVSYLESGMDGVMSATLSYTCSAGNADVLHITIKESPDGSLAAPSAITSADPSVCVPAVTGSYRFQILGNTRYSVRVVPCRVTADGFVAGTPVELTDLVSPFATVFTPFVTEFTEGGGWDRHWTIVESGGNVGYAPLPVEYQPSYGTNNHLTTGLNDGNGYCLLVGKRAFKQAAALVRLHTYTFYHTGTRSVEVGTIGVGPDGKTNYDINGANTLTNPVIAGGELNHTGGVATAGTMGFTPNAPGTSNWDQSFAVYGRQPVPAEGLWRNCGFRPVLRINYPNQVGKVSLFNFQFKMMDYVTTCGDIGIVLRSQVPENGITPLLIGTNTDNGVDRVQVNGSLYASGGLKSGAGISFTATVTNPGAFSPTHKVPVTINGTTYYIALTTA